MSYTNSELQLLSYLKHHGGKVERQGYASLYARIGTDLNMKVGLVRTVARQLEARCLLLRNFDRPKADRFNPSAGANALMSLELVDPNIELPPWAPIPLAVVIAHENEEMAERTAHEPTPEVVILALLKRNDELQTQVDKLHHVVEDMARNQRDRHIPEHLSHRIASALGPEEWERLRHAPKG
jgi:hypothetical protein